MEAVSKACVTESNSTQYNLFPTAAESSTPWLYAILDDPHLVVLDIHPSAAPLAHTSLSCLSLEIIAARLVCGVARGGWSKAPGRARVELASW